MKKASTKYGGGIQIEINDELYEELGFDDRCAFYDAIMKFFASLQVSQKQNLMLKVTLEPQK